MNNNKKKAKEKVLKRKKKTIPSQGLVIKYENGKKEINIIIKFNKAKELALLVLNDSNYRKILNFEKLTQIFLENMDSFYGTTSIEEYKNAVVIKHNFNFGFDMGLFDKIINFQKGYNKIFKKHCHSKSDYFVIWSMVFNGKNILKKHCVPVIIVYILKIKEMNNLKNLLVLVLNVV